MNKNRKRKLFEEYKKGWGFRSSNRWELEQKRKAKNQKQYDTVR